MTQTFLGTNIHGATLELIPTNLDKNAKVYFTQGQCHSLAFSLHKKLNLPMIWLECSWWGDIVHCAVQLPNGTYLDINGITNIEDTSYTAYPVPDPEAFINSCDGQPDENDAVWLEPDAVLSDVFADLVISEYAIDIAECLAV